jgi:hypothetical protein
MVALWYEEGLVDTKLFTFPKSLVDKAEEELLEAIANITAQEFPKKVVSWSDAVDLSTSADVLAKYNAPMDDENDSEE